MFDAVVIGSGISGLTAALQLQRQGVQTLVLERRAVPGGLCGTFTLDGYEFVTGCNDFGGGMARILREFGVDIGFLTPKARFQLADHVVNLPPDLPTTLKLVRRVPGLVRALWQARKSPDQSIGQLVDEHIGDPLLADAVCLPVTGMMRSPDDVTVAEVRENFAREHDYGYDKSCTPVGGPGAMIDAMVRRFAQLGGELRLDCEVLEVAGGANNMRVMTPAGPVSARTVLSSAGRWAHYPAGTKPGIEAAVLLLAVDKSWRYPSGYHTLAWFQPGVAEQLRRLDAGLAVPRPNFHIFRSDLPEQPQHYTVNAFLPLPRGERNPLAQQRNELIEHVLQTVDASLPGFRSALIYQRFLSPVEYEARLGLCCSPSPFVPPPGFQKPPSYDAERDIHFLGTSVGPPGEHAGAAARSGKLAARRAMQRLAT
ncbi:dehydrogenase [Mycobacterium angelicum]|uniref:Dehydrogenase n=1 Tax=Mycobacterium angelicum TaxID=470074 RepID=A0A1W9ZLJ7_MYCAN|nr:NAD(P)/FAD-dependent oxidoreductase [Mycobacterium angelicum]ORA17776.1 dehydrogenase [Mycobacterium angelicum]